MYAKFVSETEISYPSADEFTGVLNWATHDSALRAKGYVPLHGVPEAQDGKTLHLDKFALHEQAETRVEPRPYIVEGSTEWRDTEISVDTSYIEVAEYHYSEEEKDLETARAEKLAALEEWDNEELPDKGVNWFVIKLAGQEFPFWIKKDDRAPLMLTIDALEASGVSALTLAVNGQIIAIPISDARAMLFGIEKYANASYVATASHKAAIAALQTVAEIEEYDFKAGYPEHFVCELGGEA